MFGTSGIRGPVGETVTADVALSVGRAVASEGHERVVVGRDVRESGAVLVDAVSAGVRECGGTVLRAGVAATPTIARGVGELDADAGIVITASHNPPEDNGLKLWTHSGKAFGAAQRDAITARIEESEYTFADWDGFGNEQAAYGLDEAHQSAVESAVSITSQPAVVVDIGNGTGQITARTLDALGCEVITLNGEPNGAFPGRPSEPTEETLGGLMQTVAATDSDLGIAHDGDADRMMAVDERGRFVPKDVLLTLFATAEAGEGDSVAAPVDTSLGVEDALTRSGASLTRTKVGDVYVAEEATTDDVVFGGEPSGAWIWPEETLCPDGPLAACKLVELIEARGSLSTLVDDIEQYPIRRDAIEVSDKTGVMSRLTETIGAQYARVETLDGLRVETDDGWFLLRASGTQPLIRITAEARDSKRADSLFAEARSLVSDIV